MLVVEIQTNNNSMKCEVPRFDEGTGIFFGSQRSDTHSSSCLCQKHLYSQCQWLWIFIKWLGHRPMSFPSWLSILVCLKAHRMSATFFCPGCLDWNTNTVRVQCQTAGIIVSNNKFMASNKTFTNNFQATVKKRKEKKKRIWDKNISFKEALQ